MIKSVLTAVLFCFLVIPTTVRAEDQPIKVAASFSILADMIKQIGGEDVDVISLVGPDEDAHGFQPSPDDAKLLTEVEIIAINGLRYENWLGRLVKASETKGKLLVASAGVKLIMNKNDPAAHTPSPESPVDPHAWQDLGNGALYAKNIAAALIAARPAKKEAFQSRLYAYLAQIDALHKKAKTTFSAIPEARRKVITSHDAFAYFGRAYGITFLSPVGAKGHAEASAANVAKLIDQIKKEDVKALFIENMSNPRLIEQIAKDTGVKVGGTLYPDALSSKKGEASTYLEMMESNINRIANVI